MGAGKKRDRSRVPFGRQNHLSSGARLGQEARMRGKRAEEPKGPEAAFPTVGWATEGAAAPTYVPNSWGPQVRGGGHRPEATPAAGPDGNPSPADPDGDLVGKMNSPTWSIAARPGVAADSADGAKDGSGGKSERSGDPAGSGSGAAVGAPHDEERTGAAAAERTPADLPRPWRPRPARVHPGEPRARSMKGPRVTGTLPAPPSEITGEASSSTGAEPSSSEPPSL
jgi:hypothetical protein